MYKTSNGIAGGFILHKVRIAGKTGYTTLWCESNGNVWYSQYYDQAGKARQLKKISDLKQANEIAKLNKD